MDGNGCTFPESAYAGAADGTSVRLPGWDTDLRRVSPSGGSASGVGESTYRTVRPFSKIAAWCFTSQAVLGGPDGDLSPRREAEPAEDAGDVGIDGAPAHDEALADLAVGEAA